MSSYDDVLPSTDFVEYSLFSTDIDLVAALGTARYIEVVEAGSGALVVKLASNGGVTRTMTGLAAGYRTPIGQFRTIVASGTSVAKVRVWA